MARSFIPRKLAMLIAMSCSVLHMPLVLAQESQQTQVQTDKEENEQRYSAAIIYDLDMSYAFDNGILLSVEAMNLFDQYPKSDNPECLANACSTWNRIEFFRYSTGFGFEGRFIYSKLAYRL